MCLCGPALFCAQTLPSKCPLCVPTLPTVSLGRQVLLCCCPGGIGGGCSLACFGKLFEQLRVSIPMYELLYSHCLLQAGFVTINKTSRTRIPAMPVFVTTRLPWGRAHGWIYQCKLPRKESTFVMRFRKATKPSVMEQRGKRNLSCRFSTFLHINVSFIPQSTTWDLSGVENSVYCVSQCIWSPAQKLLPRAQLWLTLPRFLRRNAC